jgi:RES domain
VAVVLPAAQRKNKAPLILLMELETLLNQEKYSLPANNITGKPFVSFFEETIQHYISEIRTSGDLLDKIDIQLLDYAELTEAVTQLAKKTIELLKISLKNKPADNGFATMIDSVPVLQSNFGSSVHSVRKTDILFRSKFFDSTFLRTPDYFFHTPFHLNDKIKSTRFSPSGIPSLYLSNSLVLGYLETNANTLDTFQAVKFQANFETFLDLDFTKPDIKLKATDKKAYEEQLQIKALLFPLLLGCYTFKKDPDAAAPQEYIVPQLLTRWISEVNKLYLGIRYPTTKINALNKNFNGRFYNYVIPVRQYENEGFCKVLKNKLKISPVCSNIIHNSQINDYYNNEFSQKGFVNSEVKTIEWKNAQETYDTSEIGKMEFFLRHQLPVERITF